MNIRLLVLLVGSVLMAPASQAQFGSPGPETVVTWTASARPPSSAARMTNSFGAGDRVYITLSADIVEGWRVYAIDSPAGRPLTLELNALPSGIALYGSPGETATQMGHDPGLDADYAYHEGNARVWQGLQVQESAEAGEYLVTGEIRYAACNDEMCLPVKAVPFRARFFVSH